MQYKKLLTLLAFAIIGFIVFVFINLLVIKVSVVQISNSISKEAESVSSCKMVRISLGCGAGRHFSLQEAYSIESSDVEAIIFWESVSNFALRIFPLRDQLFSCTMPGSITSPNLVRGKCTGY